MNFQFFQLRPTFTFPFLVLYKELAMFLTNGELVRMTTWNYKWRNLDIA